MINLNPRKPLLFLLLFMLLPLSSPVRGDTVLVAPVGSTLPGAQTDLIRVLAGAGEGTVIQFAPGTYTLFPRTYTEDECGNCEAESTQVAATVGLEVSGRGIWLQGPDEGHGEAIIETNAGYGILFEDCSSCRLERITVTSGERDSDPNATDGAVVVKRSSVSIQDCIIRDNVGTPELVTETVVGIAGIVGRNGSALTVRNNRIVRNSWDGVVLYRGSQGTIENNVIDGVDLARGRLIGGGRGVGIGATGESFARVSGNLVRHYWKGIGVFLDAQMTAEGNVVEHVATWGMTLWDADRGKPVGNFRRNIIFDTGACGMSIVRSSGDPPPPGQVVQNVFIRTGQDPAYDSGEPYCLQMPIARHAVPPRFPINGNLFLDNREGEGREHPEDLSREAFDIQLLPILEGLQRWTAVQESDFWIYHGAPVLDAEPADLEELN
jgi:parallel beta-helix repeat protein